jgi:sister-chromatid-cohesion protein PDS5
MAHRNRSTEVFVSSYLLSARNTSELVSRLELTLSALCGTEQTDGPEGLPPGMEGVAAQLVSSHVLHSRCKEAVLLSCCSIVEVLRLYAPTPPFSPDKLRDAFATVIDRLGVLKLKDTPGEEANFERAFAMLESLVTVKSCVIVVELSAVDHSLVASFFGALLDAVLPNSSRRLEELVVEAHVACLEEMDAVSSSLLAVLLQRFLDCKTNPHTANVVTQILQRCGDKLIVPVSNAVNHWLTVSMEPGIFGGDEDTLSVENDRSIHRDSTSKAQSRFQKPENVHMLLVELARVVPAVLLHILPVLCSELDCTRVTSRLAAASVLGQLFALPVLISGGGLGKL